MIPRFLGWLIRQIGVETLLAFILLLAAISSLSWSLSDLVKELDQLLLQEVVFGAILTGWLLGKSSLPFAWSALGMGLIGLTGIIFYLESLARPAFDFLIELRNLTWLWLSHITGNTPIDTAPLAASLADITSRLSSLATRVHDWTSAILSGQSAFDPLVVIFWWSLLVWLVSAWAAWIIRRRGQVLLGMAPVGILLTAILSYVRTGPYQLLLLLGPVFLLMVLLNYKNREASWEEQGIDYSLEIRTDVGLITIPLVCIILLLASLAPSLSIRGIVNWVREANANQRSEIVKVGSSIGLQQKTQPQETFHPHILDNGLPRIHLLGSGPELSQRVVMTVRVDDNSPPGKKSYYLRSLVYDLYFGHGWTYQSAQIFSYKAGQPVIALPPQTANIPGRRLVRQEIHMSEEQDGLLFYTGSLLTADQDFRVVWRTPQSTPNDAFGAAIGKLDYRVESLVPVASPAQLRAAGTGYPDWIKNRYLALPDSVPNRVKSLAQEVTAGSATPYDRALALESYLRTFPYSLAVNAPPSQREVADYFLFDLKRGYCDYYATTMVVMARATGLPARLVVGYAPGKFDAAQSAFIVTEADAHSWVEVYFPNIGWIEFEPTASRPLIQHPDQVTPSDKTQARVSIPPISRPALDWMLALRLLIGVGVACLLFLAAWLAADSWMLSHQAPPLAIDRLYRRLRRSGNRLAGAASLAVLPGGTPYEFSAAITGRLAETSRVKFIGKAIAPSLQEVERLAQFYARSTYSSHPAASADRLKAIQSWKKLRFRLWLAWLVETARNRLPHPS